MNIIADNGTSTFQGNYVQIEDKKDYQAIWVNSQANLNLIARNNGAITMYDNINGRRGYTVNITGDETGTLNLYNDIRNANVNIDKVTFNLSDGKMYDYEFNSLTSDENAKYIIDIDFENKTPDKITTATESSGKVTLNSLHIIGEMLTNPDETYKIQVLDTQTDALQLALSDNLKAQQQMQEEYKIGTAEDKVSIIDKIKAITKWNDKYNIFEQQTDVYGTIGLATTNTENDSIGIKITRTEEGEPVLKGSQGDTLALWNGLDAEETKSFNFDSAKDVYIVAKDNTQTLGLGETKGTELNVNGSIIQL